LPQEGVTYGGQTKFWDKITSKYNVGYLISKAKL